MTYSVIEVETDHTLPFPWIGSTIRGVFGVGLKRLVCINPTQECEGCFAALDCLYYDLYERPHPPYRLEFELGGELKFKIYLFEKVASKLSYGVAGIFKGLTQVGVGKDRVKIENLTIKANGEVAYDGEFKAISATPFTFTPPPYTPNLKIVFKTPIRVKEDGKLVREGLKLETVLRSVHFRRARLKGEIPTKLPFTPSYNRIESDLTFVDFARYSNRQRTKMKLGGLMGEMVVEGVDRESFNLLALGELIGVGKQTTFGLGRIELIPLTSEEVRNEEQGKVSDGGK